MQRQKRQLVLVTGKVHADRGGKAAKKAHGGPLFQPADDQFRAGGAQLNQQARSARIRIGAYLRRVVTGDGKARAHQLVTLIVQQPYPDRHMKRCLVGLTRRRRAALAQNQAERTGAVALG